MLTKLLVLVLPVLVLGCGAVLIDVGDSREFFLLLVLVWATGCGLVQMKRNCTMVWGISLIIISFIWVLWSFGAAMRESPLPVYGATGSWEVGALVSYEEEVQYLGPETWRFKSPFTEFRTQQYGRAIVRSLTLAGRSADNTPQEIEAVARYTISYQTAKDLLNANQRVTDQQVRVAITEAAFIKLVDFTDQQLEEKVADVQQVIAEDAEKRLPQGIGIELRLLW